MSDGERERLSLRLEGGDFGDGEIPRFVLLLRACLVEYGGWGYGSQ
ncbi:MAG: hypothetical protein ACRD0K_31110 [Egibacteraceae bacterium]